jgi:hypothetical protein
VNQLLTLFSNVKLKWEQEGQTSGGLFHCVLQSHGKHHDTGNLHTLLQVSPVTAELTISFP